MARAVRILLLIMLPTMTKRHIISMAHHLSRSRQAGPNDHNRGSHKEWVRQTNAARQTLRIDKIFVCYKVIKSHTWLYILLHFYLNTEELNIRSGVHKRLGYRKTFAKECDVLIYNCCPLFCLGCNIRIIHQKRFPFIETLKMKVPLYFYERRCLIVSFEMKVQQYL